MSHGKSIARTMEVDAFSNGLAHVPDLRSLNDMAVFDPNRDQREFVAALDTGRIVVAEAFRTRVGMTTVVEPFKDKIVEPRRSAHGVTFGRMIGRCTTAQRAKRHVTHVAIKPFAHADDAVNELAGYLHLQELKVPTFEPIGVFPAKGADHFVALSAKNNNLRSLDRHNWITGRYVDSPETMAQAERNAGQVQGIAEALAYIHANGVFHPDGQIKNYVATASDKIGIIDTEKMKRTPLGDEYAADNAWADITKLVKSLVLNNYLDEDGKMFGVGMLAQLPIQTVRASIEELIVYPYVGRLEELAKTMTSPKEVTQIENLVSGIIDRFYEDDTWPQHFIDANQG